MPPDSSGHWQRPPSCGAAVAGWMAAATAIASRFDRWKNFRNVSFRFSGVSTFASGMMLVMHKLPSRRGSTISGNRCTSFAAVWR